MFQITHLWGVNGKKLFVPIKQWHVRKKDIINVAEIMTTKTHADYLPEGINKAYYVCFKTHGQPIAGHRFGCDPVVFGLIAQDQTERFERFIGGTENPIWDLLEIFKSHPTFGTETESARRRFHESLNSLEQSENKKIKE